MKSIVVDEAAFGRLLADGEVIVQAPDHTEVRLIVDVGWPGMLKAIAVAVGGGELREALDTIAVAIANGSLRAAPPAQARLRRPAET